MKAMIKRDSGSWIAALRGFVAMPPSAAERCELCSVEIESEHPHLIEIATQRLVCACRACALLFSSREAKRYRRVPADVHRLPGFALSDEAWDAFLIPVDMAFFVRRSAEDRVVALYPGPAGPTEAKVDLKAWDDLAAQNPALDEFEEDVEALLINRTEGAREYYRVPIDRCYELVGEIRRNWHGLSGGEEVRRAIRAFFAALREEMAEGEEEHA